MGDEEQFQTVSSKEQFQPPPESFWRRGERPGITVKLADLTPREWRMVVWLLTTFFIVGIMGGTFLIYGVKAVVVTQMDKDFLQSGYIAAETIIEQGGFVYNGKVYAVGESSIMTTPEQIKRDLDDTIKMNKQLRKDIQSLKDSLEYERDIRRPRVVPTPKE